MGSESLGPLVRPGPAARRVTARLGQPSQPCGRPAALRPQAGLKGHDRAVGVSAASALSSSPGQPGPQCRRHRDTDSECSSESRVPGDLGVERASLVGDPASESLVGRGSALTRMLVALWGTLWRWCKARAGLKWITESYSLSGGVLISASARPLVPILVSVPNRPS